MPHPFRQDQYVKHRSGVVGGAGAREIARQWDGRHRASVRKTLKRFRFGRSDRHELFQAVREVIPLLRPAINCDYLDDVWTYFFTTPAIGYVSLFEYCYYQANKNASAGSAPHTIAEQAFDQYARDLDDWAPARVCFEHLCGHGADAKYAALQGRGHGIECFGPYSIVLTRSRLNDAVLFRGNSAEIVKMAARDTEGHFRKLSEVIAGRSATNASLRLIVLMALMQSIKRDSSGLCPKAVLRATLGSQYSLIEVCVHGPVFWKDVEYIQVHPGRAEQLEDAARAWLDGANPGESPYPATSRVSEDGEGKQMIDEVRSLAKIMRHGLAQSPDFRVEPPFLHELALELTNVIDIP